MAGRHTEEEDAFYHACEQSDLTVLDALYRPGFESMVRHKLDFEDAAGARWFIDHGADVNGQGALPWAIGRGRGVEILELLLDAGADIELVHRDFGLRPIEVAARSGHLAAYDLLVARGAVTDLDPDARAVLAVARGESTALPDAPSPMPYIRSADHGWLLGQFALLGRTEVVRSLLDTGLAVDLRGWSNFTPLDLAAMAGRVDTVRVLVNRGADLADHAFDDEGPTPLDCAIWGVQHNRTADGDYVGTIRTLIDAGAPTSNTPPTGDPVIDELLERHLRPR